MFSEHIHEGDAPSLVECVMAIKDNSELKSRTPNQLKAWVVNQINKSTRRPSKIRG